MEESESSVGLFKTTAALLLFIFAVVGGLLPQKLKDIGSKVVSCLNTAAGGVFLASAMVHMLPESSETLATSWGDAFPWGELMCTIGFLLILCTDQAVRICQDRGANKRSGGHSLVPTQEPPDAGHNHTGGECGDRHVGDGEDYTELSGVPHQTLLGKDNGGQACPNGNVNGVDRLGGEENGVDQHRDRGGRDVEPTGGSVNHRPAPRNGNNWSYDVTSNMYSGGISNPAAQNGSHSEGRRGHSHGLGSPGDGVLVRVALLLALSVHSIMEGLGVGAKSSKAYNLLFAIGIHKGLAAYALGTALLDSAISFNEVLGFLIAFALMSPLGILIGAIIENDGEDDAPGAACVALASGTFLYVSLMEVLPPELDSTKHGWSKMASLLAGFSLSAVMGWIVG